MADLVSECNVVSAVHSVTCNVPVTVRMADLVSECNVVSAVHSYVPVPVPVTVEWLSGVRMAHLVSECNVVRMLYIRVCPCTCTCNVPVTVRMADLVSECNVVSAVHSYVPVPVTYL